MTPSSVQRNRYTSPFKKFLYRLLETLRDGSLQMAYRFQIKICIPVFSMINKLNDSPSEYSFYGHHENAE